MRGWTRGSDDWQCQKRQIDPAEWGLMIWNWLLQFAGLQWLRVAQTLLNGHSWNLTSSLLLQLKHQISKNLSVHLKIYIFTVTYPFSLSLHFFFQDLTWYLLCCAVFFSWQMVLLCKELRNINTVNGPRLIMFRKCMSLSVYNNGNFMKTGALNTLSGDWIAH